VRALVVLAVAFVAGCTGPETQLQLPSADPIVFRDKVYPILLRDCGFQSCHGNKARFFSVFGPGRARLDPATQPYDPVTPYELALSFTRARSMLVGPDGPHSSLLVRKPIPLVDGGSGHKGGDDPWGDPVYASTSDPSYVAIYRWATALEGP
jgi:hypothetical protein